MAASRQKDDPQFHLLSEQEINDLIDGTDSKSTKTQENYQIWLHKAGEFC